MIFLWDTEIIVCNYCRDILLVEDQDDRWHSVYMPWRYSQCSNCRLSIDSGAIDITISWTSTSTLHKLLNDFAEYVN